MQSEYNTYAEPRFYIKAAVLVLILQELLDVLRRTPEEQDMRSFVCCLEPGYT